MFDWIKAAIKWLTNILGLGSKKETPPEADISTMPKDELAKKIKSFFDNDEGWENAISFRRTEWRKEADRLERGLAGREVQFLPDSYFFYLPLKERRNLIKVFTQILWRRRSQLISDPGGCLRSGTIGMSTASRITSFIREIRDRIRNFDFQKLTLFHSSRVKVRPILINVYDWVAFVFFPLQFPRDRKRLLYCTTSEELNESCGWPTESMGKGSFSLKMKSSSRCTLRSTTPWSPRNGYSLSLLRYFSGQASMIEMARKIKSWDVKKGSLLKAALIFLYDTTSGQFSASIFCFLKKRVVKEDLEPQYQKN